MTKEKNSVLYLILKITALTLNLFNLIMFFSMRCCWSGISKTLGYEDTGSWFILNLPLLLCILFFVLALTCIILAVANKKGRVWPVVFAVLGVIFLAAIFVIIKLGATDYMRFIWEDFFEALGVCAVVGALVFLIFVYPKTRLADNKPVKFAAIGIIALCAIAFLVKFNINYVSYEPVVYAVEDEYQIVFSSNAISKGWVTVDGEDYYDLSAGSQKTNTRIHKVSVPMAVLDDARSYEIHVQHTVYAGPFGGLMGKIISKTYSFKPVDLSDGFTYLSFSDVHMSKEAVIKTENAVETALNGYDLLVLDGDLVSDVETFRDANYINEIAFALTGGEMPVIYARGNHEVKGAYADRLYQFVGSINEKFYFTVHLGGDKGVYVLVLDMGEDHDDDWWEYYETADFDSYRAEQTEMMKAEISKGEYADYAYKMMVCHIPVVFVNYRHNHVEVKAAWTELLNQFDFDMTLCAHQHSMFVFEPGAVVPETKLTYNPIYHKKTYNGYLTDFNFPELMCSKPGYTQTDEDWTSHIGLLIEVDLKSRTQICKYINSLGQTVPVVNPFAEIDYGEGIEIDLNTKIMK